MPWQAVDYGSMDNPRALASTRMWLALFSLALIASGLTAILARDGLRLLAPAYGQGSLLHSVWPSVSAWLSLVRQAVEETYDRYPFLAYGYDWLAFGHFVISVPFIMAIRDPVRHSWVISYGIAACIAVLPFAIVFGAVRGIPLFWRVVDTLFGLGGLVVLLILRRHLRAVADAATAATRSA